MSQRSIEEVFQAIAPSRRRGLTSAPAITVGVTGSGGADTAASMSQAAQEIARLRAQYQQQAELISANTQALQNAATSQSGRSVSGTIGNATSGLLGGGLGFLSPIASGIMKLFGGGGSTTPAPLPFYTPPNSVMISETLRSATPRASAPGSAGAPATGSINQASVAPQITVNVSAMDSQSFMDRSGDIASAVREAMLNLHPINDVVASL